jgi:peptidoglycan/xylan/chitin deacetylase (PgdA/CDA1 family)
MSTRQWKKLFIWSFIALFLIVLGFAIYFGCQTHAMKLQLEKLRTEADAKSVAGELQTQAPLKETRAAEEPSYRSMYPEMFVETVHEYTEDDGAAYLTFDDGPSENTATILDTLAENDVKATFFAVYHDTEDEADLLQRMVREGHTVGVHSYSHNYETIYISVEAFLDDFYKEWEHIYEVTGERAWCFRFPGGSINSYNSATYQEIIAEMTRRGFTYFDWNVSSGDASSETYGVSQLTHNVLSGICEKPRGVILMHDAAPKEQSALAVSSIIDGLQEAGYTILPLTQETRPITF